MEVKQKMKGLCYIALIIGFFIFYQQNPVYAVIIIVLFIGVYIFLKSRTSGGGGVLGFLSGRNPQQDSKIDDLIMLMMIQQLMNPSERETPVMDSKKEERRDQIEKIKNEVLGLLDED